MKVEERIERAKTEGRLRELLTLEQLRGPGCGPVEKRVNDLHELCVTLATALSGAQASLIRQQEQIMTQQAAIETLANIVGAEEADKATGLVGFDTPKLVTN